MESCLLMLKSDPIALDTETTLIRPGVLAPEMVCVSWAMGDRSEVLHHSDPEARIVVEEALLHSEMVFANAPYDLAVFAQKWPDLLPAVFIALEEGRVHDIQTREKLLDLARGTLRFETDENGKTRKKGYSLFDLAGRRLGITLDKDTWRLRYGELIDIPVSDWPIGAIEYADGDAVSTLRIFEAQEELGKYLYNAADQVRGHFALHLASCWGMRTSGDDIDDLEVRVRAESEGILPLLVREGLARADGSRITKGAVRRALKAIPREDLVWTTKFDRAIQSGKMTIDRAIFEAEETGSGVSVAGDVASKSGDPTLEAYARFGQLQSLLSGSIQDLRAGVEAPIQTRYEILMETGRTSSSSPNIQNLRREPGVRECFHARPGFAFIAADYAAAELHTLAQTCLDLLGHSELAITLNEGRDVHLWVAAILARCDYGEAVRRRDSGDAEIKRLRQLAKAANFGFPGGCSPKTFRAIAEGYGVKITDQESAVLKRKWLESWPEMSEYFSHVKSQKDDSGSFFVRLPRSARIRSRCSYTAACNSYFQGLAADAAKEALFRVSKACHVDPRSDLWGSHIVAFIHDEIIIEAPIDRVDEAARALSEVMEEAFALWVPEVPSKVETVAMLRWSKDAERVVEDGRLVPWKG